MEIGRQIKNHRADMGISQEELAERVYVTRQTVSNWETEKSYPDIHSLLAMSQLEEERKKEPFQKFLLVIIFAIIAFVVALLVLLLLKLIFKQ